MVNSMTGFATQSAATDALQWSWEIRSVNARGLDVRLRLADGFDALDQPIRKKIAARAARGNISVSFKVVHKGGGTALHLNEALLDQALAAQATIEKRATAAGVTLQPSSSATLLQLRGMMDMDAETPINHAQDISEILSDFDKLLDEFAGFRATEGAGVAKVLNDQINQIAVLVSKAQQAAEARRPQVAERLRENLAKLLDNDTGADPDRLAQELALLAVKADVSEEIDRLMVHVETAKGLLAGGQPVGRKLDFLAQEFNREANTLCSKSGSAELTAIGLDLKVVIDQMREQVQNVE